MFRVVVFVLLALLPVGAQAHECPPLGWDVFLDPGPQDYDVVEHVALPEGRRMIGVTFGPMAGAFAKLHLFLQLDGHCIAKALSAGQYSATKDLGNELFHIDLYEPGRHATLGFVEQAPSYETLRAQALEIFQ